MASLRSLKDADPGYSGHGTRLHAPYRPNSPRPGPWVPEDQFRAWVATQRAEKEARRRAEIEAERAAREPELRGRLRPYGLSVTRYYEMLDEQKGNCAACGHGMTEPFVDHCHLTLVVRGLVHRNCNSALGFADDSPAILRALAAYLERQLQ